METPEEAIKSAVSRWVETVVVGLNLCPFAKPLLRDNGLAIVVSAALTEEELLADLANELHQLDHSESPTTIVATTLLSDFSAYNEFLALVDGLLESMGLRGVIQVATFHPEYRFEDSEPDDPANYTNRSPYPLFHLLREDDVSQAVETHPDTLEIPARNVALMRDLGLEAVKAQLLRCSESSTEKRPTSGE